MNRRNAMLAIGMSALGLAAGCRAGSDPAPATSAAAPLAPVPEPSTAELSPGKTAEPTINIDTGTWVSWTLLDRQTRRVASSANSAELSNTASMIKAWLAADYLRQADRHPGSAVLRDLSDMIRDSANEPASALFTELGRRATITRMNELCGTSAEAGDGFGRSRMSANDACLLADSIGNGTAAGPEWTPWLIEEMRQVRGEGDFGIRKAFSLDQQAGIAITNGWDTWSPTNDWTVNCLALTDDWAMSVLTRYPENLGREHGVRVTEAVATELRTAVTEFAGG